MKIPHKENTCPIPHIKSKIATEGSWHQVLVRAPTASVRAIHAPPYLHCSLTQTSITHTQCTASLAMVFVIVWATMSLRLLMFWWLLILWHGLKNKMGRVSSDKFQVGVWWARVKYKLALVTVIKAIFGSQSRVPFFGLGEKAESPL